MKFKLNLDLDNAAFDTDNGDLFGPARNGQEIARILREVADRVSGDIRTGTHGSVRDINGNRVGAWKVTK